MLVERVNRLIEQHGGIRPAARALEIDPAYLMRLRDSIKINPSDDTLRKLGLRKVVTIRYVPR